MSTKPDGLCQVDVDALNGDLSGLFAERDHLGEQRNALLRAMREALAMNDYVGFGDPASRLAYVQAVIASAIGGAL